jgi:hypothetical protein
MFENKQKEVENKDLRDNKSLEYYLELTKDFKSSFNPFVVKEINGFHVIDESESNPVGAKARFAEFFVKNLQSDEIVYVQPRTGFAGISLAYLCKMYNKKLTLIMPASKESSEHQRLCIELGAKPLFLKIPAMSYAAHIGKKYAEKNNAVYVLLGLQHELVTAGAVRSIHDYFKDKPHPKRMWCVISTGVLSRSLQIALPNTEFFNIAVSRNIQQGELGNAEFYTYHRKFHAKSDVIPTEFNCEPCYDSKGWDYMQKYGEPGDWFFSVAGKAPQPKIQASEINSQREWNDLSDFNI